MFPSLLFILHCSSFHTPLTLNPSSHAPHLATPEKLASSSSSNLTESDRNVTTTMCAGSSLTVWRHDKDGCRYGIWKVPSVVSLLFYKNMVSWSSVSTSVLFHSMPLLTRCKQFHVADTDNCQRYISVLFWSVSVLQRRQRICLVRNTNTNGLTTKTAVYRTVPTWHIYIYIYYFSK